MPPVKFILALLPRLRVLASLGFVWLVSTAVAEERLVPQFGNVSAPTGLFWSPHGKWFATATEADIVLWDAETGAVLRAFHNFAPATKIALVESGTIVAARDASGQVRAWRAETGAPHYFDEAAAKNIEWQNIASDDQQLLFGEAAQTFLEENKLRPLIAGPLLQSKNDVLQIIKTNAKDIVLVSYSQQDIHDGKTFFSFVDSRRKELIVSFDSDTPGLGCGSPDVAFARHGYRIALAPTARDASHFFSNAEVIDLSREPPRVKWTHFCRDFMFSNISVANGRIYACPKPDHCAIWDPESAKIAGRLSKLPRGHQKRRSISPDGKYRLVAGEEGRVQSIVETATGRILLSPRGVFHSMRIYVTSGPPEDGRNSPSRIGA
jgi:WD40 repeat protein